MVRTGRAVRAECWITECPRLPNASATDVERMPEDVIVPDGAAAGRARATGLTRRGLLAASGIAVPVLLAGCKGVQVLGAPPGTPADVVALRAAISAEELMVARYAAAVSDLDTTIPSAPSHSDAASLRAVRAVQAEHAEHLAQLKSRLVEPAGSSPSPSPAPSVRVTGSLSEVLGLLEQAEQAASDRLIGQLDELPGSLAQLFASIAASEATHVPFLRTAGQAR
jgi:Ferritin-like domain